MDHPYTPAISYWYKSQEVKCYFLLEKTVKISINDLVELRHLLKYFEQKQMRIPVKLLTMDKSF